MSHPDPQHDPEYERLDDDLLREEIDARRQEDDRDAMQESLKVAYAAEAGIRSDQHSRIYGGATHGTAPDGRPLYIGTETYEQWVKTDKRGAHK